MSENKFYDYLLYALTGLAAMFMLYQCEQSSTPSVPRYDMIDCEPVYTERGMEC